MKPSTLIIEDDAVARQVISAAVRSYYPEHMTVLEAETISQAKEKIETPEIFLVILDLQLPDGSGMEFLRTMLSGERKAAVLVLTGDERDDALKLALEMGADDFLSKPIDLPVFESKVKSLLHKRYSSPFSFLGNAEDNPSISIDHPISVRSLQEDRVIFSVPMFLQKGARVHLKVGENGLEFDATVSHCDARPGGKSFLIDARMGEDLPLAAEGKIRKLLITRARRSG
jgi:DNA-binding response OmpR family regulator